MEIQKKTFAFRLSNAVASETSSTGEKWKARDGLSIAGCTDKLGDGNYQDNIAYPEGPDVGKDNGYFC